MFEVLVLIGTVALVGIVIVSWRLREDVGAAHFPELFGQRPETEAEIVREAARDRWLTIAVGIAVVLVMAGLD
jgi:hypothetical protein